MAAVSWRPGTFLFELPNVRNRGMSPEWLPVRAAFKAATAGAGPKAG